MGQFGEQSYCFFSQSIIVRPQDNRIPRRPGKVVPKKDRKNLLTGRLNLTYAGNCCDIVVEDHWAWIAWTIWGCGCLTLIINSLTLPLKSVLICIINNVENSGIVCILHGKYLSKDIPEAFNI